jgi:hypothetical protein
MSNSPIHSLVLLDQDTLPSILWVHVVDVKMAVGGGHEQPGKLLDPENEDRQGSNHDNMFCTSPAEHL